MVYTLGSKLVFLMLLLITELPQDSLQCGRRKSRKSQRGIFIKSIYPEEVIPKIVPPQVTAAFPQEAFKCVYHGKPYTPGALYYQRLWQHVVHCYYENVAPAADIVVKFPSGDIISTVRKSKATENNGLYALVFWKTIWIEGNTILSVYAVSENVKWRIDLPVYYAGGNAGVRVRLPYPGDALVGDTYTLRCHFQGNFVYGQRAVVPDDEIELSRLEWHEMEGLYGYKIYEYDVETDFGRTFTPPFRDDEDMNRYSRNEYDKNTGSLYDLVIDRFESNDARDKCCSVEVKDKRTDEKYSSAQCMMQDIRYTAQADSPLQDEEAGGPMADADVAAAQQDGLDVATIGGVVGSVAGTALLVAIIAVAVHINRKREKKANLTTEAAEIAVKTS